MTMEGICWGGIQEELEVSSEGEYDWDTLYAHVKFSQNKYKV